MEVVGVPGELVGYEGNDMDMGDGGIGDMEDGGGGAGVRLPAEGKSG